MGNIVSLVKTESSKNEIRNSIKKALDLINFELGGSMHKASIAIKVNLCYYWTAATGQTTDPRVVAGIIHYIRERCGSNAKIRVVEADATAMRVKHAFLMLGYEELAKEENIDLFNLSEDYLIDKSVEVNGRKIAFKVPQSLLNCDFFINVPKIKMARETKITCSLKNIFGCIGSPRKIVYHSMLSEAIIGINKILRPNLTIVDGLVASGRFPVHLGLIMASVDQFSIDWVASQIMGYNPLSIEVLQVAMREKLGDPKGVTTRGEDPTAFKKMFPKGNFFSSREWWNIQLKLLRFYANLTGDVIPPFLEET